MVPQEEEESPVQAPSEKPNYQHLNKHHVGYISGPILFTAPHSKYVYRGGQQYGGQEKKEPLELHARQKYASWIAVQFAFQTCIKQSPSPYSFMVWGDVDKEAATTEDKDPNYLLEHMFKDSQFHLALHKFADQNKDLPLLHVDVHGLANRQVCDIDVGMKALENYWGEEDPLFLKIRNYFDTLPSIFEDSKVPDCKFNTNGEKHGFWKKYKKWKPNRHTMAEQSVKLGIPGFQLQLPKKVRKELFQNPNLMAKFSQVFTKLYEEVIVPAHENKEKLVPLQYEKDYAEKFTQTVSNEEEAKEVRQQLLKMNKK